MKCQKGTFITILASLISVSSVLAIQSGFGPLDNVLGMIAKVFNFPGLQNNPDVQVGIIRFGVFMMLFSVIFFSISKKFERKPAGIIAFVVSFIGTALMPRAWVFASGGTFVLLVSLAIPLAVCGTLLWLAFKQFPHKGSDGQASIVNDVIAIMILIIAIVLLELYIIIGVVGVFLPLAFMLHEKHLRRILWRR